MALRPTLLIACATAAVLVLGVSARAADLEGRLGTRTRVGTVAEDRADYVIEMSEAACNRFLANLCRLQGHLKQSEAARFEDLKISLAGEACIIEGVARNIKHVPRPFDPLRFRLETVLELKENNQFDLVIKRLDLRNVDGSANLGLSLLGRTVGRLVALLMGNRKFKDYLEISTSGFVPIPLLGGLFTRKIHIKLRPKALPILNFIDSIQMSRDGDRFIIRGICSRPE